LALPVRFCWEGCDCARDSCAGPGESREHIRNGSVSGERRSPAKEDQAGAPDPIESFRLRS
jgi:hypothetical protein